MLHSVLYIFWLFSFCEIDGIRPTSTDLTPPASFMQYEKNMNRGRVVQHYCSVGVSNTISALLSTLSSVECERVNT